MLRRDSNARFDKSGIGIFSRYRFASGRVEAQKTLSQGAYDRLRSSQAESPQLVMDGDKRRWWLFRDEFYSDDEGYEAVEVKALALERQLRKERRVRRAVALMDGAVDTPVVLRDPISDEVKTFVWNRDGGCCTSCGGRGRLEFDHIIPVSMGGSNTARNLQLLCETCNRTKGGSLV